MRLKSLALIALLALTGCVTETQKVFVPVDMPPTIKPSSLTPLPIMLFNQTKQGRKLFTLDAEFPYCDPATGWVIVVPKWYVTDFASVPWYGQGMVDPQGPTARAAIVHDWLDTIGEPGKRDIADAIFYRAMVKFGVQDLQARTAYTAVHIGGQAGYGLSGDWSFVDPTRQDVKQPAPFPKPKSGVIRIMPGCKGFNELIASGWRAYPEPLIKIAVPPPVIEKKGPGTWISGYNPFGKKKK